MTPEEWLSRHPKHFLGEVLEALLKDHSHHYPVFHVPKDEATRLKYINARGQEAMDMTFNPEHWVKERSKFKECKTCPDVAGWPCPTRERIAEMLEVDPE
ncbi:hypothetical protein [Kocuria massiliensis]|uniref:hypothetical protein n=1 Tax=Kocuria massiliensis TaxID=1926282 RepID=UPI0022B97626|nr:hypothetical protein [Kocuria massiliensis]